MLVLVCSGKLTSGANFYIFVVVLFCFVFVFFVFIKSVAVFFNGEYVVGFPYGWCVFWFFFYLMIFKLDFNISLLFDI